MKKLFILLIALISFVAVNAQSSRDEARRIILGRSNHGNYSGYPNSYRYVYRSEKERRMNEYIYRNSLRNRNYRRYDEDDSYDRYERGHDNGKHKGWFKGRGNKHRDRDDD